MILVENITLQYGTETALDNVSFSIKRGECVSIVEASGCGKTSLLYTIASLTEPDSGKVSKTAYFESAGVLFQKDLLLPWKTIEHNILLGLKKSSSNREKAESGSCQGSYQRTESTSFG